MESQSVSVEVGKHRVSVAWLHQTTPPTDQDRKYLEGYVQRNVESVKGKFIAEHNRTTCTKCKDMDPEKRTEHSERKFWKAAEGGKVFKV